MNELISNYSGTYPEAGIDEAGRGCLAGPVVAAAVILPQDFTHPHLNDSKQLSAARRSEMRALILEHALAWQVGIVSPGRIDEINILNATFEAMHIAIAGLGISPVYLCIDGNRFRPYPGIPHSSLVKGDSKYLHIAAASILAKTTRDAMMLELHQSFPHYGWDQNKGYPTAAHRAALREHGSSPWHRLSFRLQEAPTLFDT
ncbi:MAG: ribonuclease HII [Bacteroidetes bacterium]|nr:MAG: ribonuclease HII [Bacteroidota bacterium]